jgi:hypothetical protein
MIFPFHLIFYYCFSHLPYLSLHASNYLWSECMIMDKSGRRTHSQQLKLNRCRRQRDRKHPRKDIWSVKPEQAASIFMKYRSKSWDSSVGIAMSCRTGVRFPAGVRFFSSPSRREPPIQWIPGVLSLRVKRPGSEAEHSTASSVEVTSTPPRLHGIVLKYLNTGRTLLALWKTRKYWGAIGQAISS